MKTGAELARSGTGGQILCDRCGRNTKGNYLLYAGAIICGVCQWEKYHGKVED